MMQLRMTDAVHKEMRSDLRRSHPFAYERLGYIFIKPAGGAVLVATGYEPVPDEFYIEDMTVGARIDHRGIALAMKRAGKTGFSMSYSCRPWISRFSRDDLADHPNLLRSFRNADSKMPTVFCC